MMKRNLLPSGWDGGHDNNWTKNETHTIPPKQGTQDANIQSITYNTQERPLKCYSLSLFYSACARVSFLPFATHTIERVNRR